MVSLPCSTASSRRSLENQERILLRARADLTNVTQSWLGPAPSAFGGKHLDDVTVLQYRVQRNQSPVHTGSNSPVANLGVHRIREVDGRRACRKGDDIALRRKHKDLSATDLETQRLEELTWIGCLLLPVEQLTQPRHVVAATGSGGVFLVLPVGSDSVFGTTVHRMGADLQLYRLSLRADHGRVQRLVHVELRHRDVVLETPRHRVPSGMDHAKGRIAVTDGVDE